MKAADEGTFTHTKFNDANRVLILASGQYEGWKETGGRHLLLVGGNSLILRTAIQLRERGLAWYDDIVIVSNRPEILSLWDGCFRPKDDTHLLSTFLSTRELWADDGRTIILMGDLIWSDKSLDSVLDCKADLMFHLGLPAGVLALTFCPAWHNELITTTEDLLKDPRLGQTESKRRLMGHLHRAMCGFDVMGSTSPRDKKSPHHTMVTGSFTRDIDSLEDYLEFLEEHPWAKSPW